MTAEPVAPLTGAWIETAKYWSAQIKALVAPLTGAWIETKSPYRTLRADPVAPLTGAWIETPLAKWRGEKDRSRPSRARGSKHDIPSLGWYAFTLSRPSRARGSKLRRWRVQAVLVKSRPSRARGSKH